MAEPSVNNQGFKPLVAKWLTEIDSALVREKEYRKQANKCVKLFEAQSEQVQPFAILYSNTETLAPAIYNSPPVPMVERRFKDADPVGKMAAEASTRMLKFLIAAESEDYDNFDELIQPAILDTLVTNRGLTRFKYQPTIQDEKVVAECVYGEAVRWDKFCHGYARTWKKVPWICFEWDMGQSELKDNFGEAIASKIKLDDADGGSMESRGSAEPSNTLKDVKLAKVYEVWDKATSTIYFISPSYKDGLLKEPVKDPLKLSGFFPVPKPLNFMRKVSTLVPTPLYIQYEAQAMELNTITVRLRKLIDALRVRGFYNSTVDDIEKVLKAEDNELIPLTNLSAMPDGMGVDKLIYILPLAEIATTVQTLYAQREQCKQVIYEITGISDILRGSSVASETATAQNIKNQWGTLRLKKMQKEAQRYCRDALRIMLEIAVAKFSVKTISAMTGLPYPTQEQKMGAVQQLQQSAMQAHMMASQLQMPNALPPQVPQPDPQLVKVAQGPSWDDVMTLLKNEVSRSYRVDIETNSTIDAEATQDKQDIAELLNALSQFLNGVAPLIENGSMPFDVAKQIMLAISRRFTFGPQLEDSLNAMSAPQPPAAPPPDPSIAAKAEVDKAKAAADLQKIQAQSAASQQQAQSDQQMMQMEMEVKQLEIQLKRQELEMKGQEMGMKSEFAVRQHQMKLQSLDAKVKADAAKPKAKAE